MRARESSLGKSEKTFQKLFAGFESGTEMCHVKRARMKAAFTKVWLH